VFEGIASLRISQIRNQVVQSQDFFNELWKIYSDIRVDSSFHYGRRLSLDQINNKELFVVITGEAGFSGDIDEKLIRWMLTQYDPKKHDIVVIGRHGAMQLVQKGVSIVRYYKMPQKDQNINPVPIIEEIIKYKA